MGDAWATVVGMAALGASIGAGIFYGLESLGHSIRGATHWRVVIESTPMDEEEKQVLKIKPWRVEKEEFSFYLIAWGLAGGRGSTLIIVSLGHHHHLWLLHLFGVYEHHLLHETCQPSCVSFGFICIANWDFVSLLC